MPNARSKRERENGLDLPFRPRGCTGFLLLGIGPGEQGLLSFGGFVAVAITPTNTKNADTGGRPGRQVADAIACGHLPGSLPSRTLEVKCPDP